jgi:WD40 repeat protein
VQQAIARTAEAVYATLSPPEQERVRDIFVRLTRLDEEATQGEERRDTRRRVDAEELVPAGSSPAATKALVERLADVRLVVTGRNIATGREEVEVAHEALIRYWPRLRGWLDEDRASLRLREGIREAAQEWQAGGKEEGLLVHRGSRLEEAAGLDKNPRFALNALEQAYVTACVALQKRGDRRRQMLTLVAGVVAVIFLGLALLAWRQQKNAEQQRDAAEWQRQIALARQLAAQAELIRNQPGALEHSVQLAAEATRRLLAIGIRSPETDLTLRRSLALLPRYVDRFALDGPVGAFTFSADGQRLTAVNASLDARVWEITGPREVVRMTGESVVRETGWSVTLSPDGTSLTVSHCNNKGVIRVLQIDGGQERGTLPCENSIAAVALSPEGKYLALHNKQSLQLWEVDRLQEITRLPDGPFDRLIFSPHGRYLAAVGAHLRVWEILRHGDVTRLEEVSNLERTPASFVTFSPEGKYLATMGDDTIRVLDLANGQVIASVKYDGSLFAVSPGGKYIAVARDDEATQVLEIATQQEITRIPYAHRLNAQGYFTSRHAAFHPDEKLLAIQNENYDVEIWEITPRDNAVLHIATDDTVIDHLMFHAEKYVTAISDRTLHTWEIAQNRAVSRWEQQLSLLAIAGSADGRYMAVATDDGTTTVWEAISHQKVTHVPHGGSVQAMALSWDGRYLAMAINADSVYVWEIASPGPRQVAHFPYQGDLQAMILGRDGQSMTGVFALEEANYFEGKELIAQVWQRGNQEEVKRLALGKERYITFCALSQDGRYLAMSAEEKVSIQEMASGRTVTTLGYQGGVIACDFSANGQYLAAAGQDGMVRVWELPGGQEVTRLEQVEMDAIVVSPEGKYLATLRRGRGDTSGGSTVRVWPLQQPELITEACARLTRNLTEAKWQQYIGREPYRKTCPHRP